MNRWLLAALAFLGAASVQAQVATVDIPDFDGTRRTVRAIPALGPQTGAASRSVVFATDATLPAFAATPAFTISGTLPAFAATPAFTLSGTGAVTQSGTWTVQPGNTANTTPWLATINQGGNSAAVKAASTAAAAADPALTVAVSPNNVVQTGSGVVVRCYPPGGGMAAALHAAGTALGNARTCANSFRSAAANSGTLSAVSSTWYIGVTPQVTVLLFSRALTTSTCTDNAAVVITDVDLEYMFATVTLNHEAYSAFSSGSFGISRFVQEVASTDSFTSLYMCVVADTAVTPTGGFDNYVGLHMNRH